MLWQRRLVSSLELRRARPADGDTSTPHTSVVCGPRAVVPGDTPLSLPSTPAVPKPAPIANASHGSGPSEPTSQRALSQDVRLVNLGDLGEFDAIIKDRWGVVGLVVDVPNHHWPGYTSGETPCEIIGFVDKFPWPPDQSQSNESAFIVRHATLWRLAPATVALRTPASATPLTLERMMWTWMQPSVRPSGACVRPGWMCQNACSRGRKRGWSLAHASEQHAAVDDGMVEEEADWRPAEPPHVREANARAERRARRAAARESA